MMTVANNTAQHAAALRFYGSARTGQRLDYRTVAAAAAGRWLAILPALGIADEYLRDRHGPCPGCGGRDRFRYDDRDGSGSWLCSTGGGAPLASDGFGLLEHVHGWSASEALHHVADVLGLASDRPLPPIQPRRPAPATPDPAAIERTRTQFNRLWSAGVLLDHGDAEPGRQYLDARGLSALVERADWPHDVRLHTCCPYWLASDAGRPQRLAELPALLALVRAPDGAPVGLHTTWLRADGSGKAELHDGAGNPLPARKLRLIARGAGAGAAVRLYPPGGGERLAIAEGLETALAVRCADPSLPVWSGLTAGGVAAAVLPAGVREALLIVDADPAGARAALTLARRLRAEGRAVRVIVPPTVATEGCRHGA